jgi:predicted PurR-regulated permease PerM
LALGLYKVVLGDFAQAIGFVVVALVAGTTDNLLRPILLSSNEQDLNPVIALLAIIGALLVFGMPGLFIGPVVAGVALKIVPAMFEAPAPLLTEDVKGRSKKET